MSRRPKGPRRPVKQTVLIVCEGKETERNYFDGLKRTDEVSKFFKIRVVPGQGGSRLQIVRHAVKKAKQFQHDECWCVLDTERLNNEETQKDFADATELAGEKNIKIVLSNPSFEVWLIAHFERTSKAFNCGDAACAHLDKWFQRSLKRDYDKSDQDLFNYVRDLVDDACCNAKDVRTHDHGDKTDVADCNSSTSVNKLVEHLRPESTGK